METIQQTCYAKKSSFTEVRKTAKNKKRIKITKLDILYTIVLIQLLTFALLLNAVLINLFTI
jgi:hypothetical protein